MPEQYQRLAAQRLKGRVDVGSLFTFQREMDHRRRSSHAGRASQRLKQSDHAGHPSFQHRGVVQSVMSRHAGIGRDEFGLTTAAQTLVAAALASEPSRDSRRAVEDAALTLVARSLLSAARARHETRGCHVRTDFPERDDRQYAVSLMVCLDQDGRPVLGHRRSTKNSAA